MPVQFLDPAFGTGAFYTALLRTFPPSQIASARAFERDPAYGEAAAALWSREALQLHISDFTLATPDTETAANLIVCNPPYVRHQHMPGSEKVRLQTIVRDRLGLELSGRTGMHGYFL